MVVLGGWCFLIPEVTLYEKAVLFIEFRHDCLVPPQILRGPMVRSNPGRGVPLRYSRSWNLQFWHPFPLRSGKVTFAIAPRLILGGWEVGLEGPRGVVSGQHNGAALERSTLALSKRPSKQIRSFLQVACFGEQTQTP